MTKENITGAIVLDNRLFHKRIHVELESLFSKTAFFAQRLVSFHVEKVKDSDDR